MLQQLQAEDEKIKVKSDQGVTFFELATKTQCQITTVGATGHESFEIALAVPDSTIEQGAVTALLRAAAAAWQEGEVRRKRQAP